jgi:DNA helicase-2/ATP-dependent DNA helicase PcrA
MSLLEKSGYLAMWEMAGPTEIERVEALKELASNLRTYEENSEEELPSLFGFLEEAALMTDADNYDADADTLVLMTMHAAKGLEFPVVFLPGFEENVFPGIQTMFRPEELEEDRRLCYVAITRAKKELFITCARSRMLYGSTTRNRSSRFLQEIPQSLLELHEQERATYTSYGEHSYRSERSGGYTSSFAQPSSEPVYRPKSGEAWGGGISASGIKSAPKAPAASGDWQVGDRVNHKTFGNGTIQAVVPMGSDVLLTITFEKVGTKKIMTTYAKLTKL